MEGALGRAPSLGNPKDVASVSIGVLLGNLKWVHLPGLLREMNNIFDYLFEPGGHSGFKSE
jgi:hypothetical protein